MPKSAIWQHFTEIDAEKKVSCLYCQQQLSVANKSTLTLIRHLTKKHPKIKIRRYSSTDAHTSHEVLLINNDDMDLNPDSPDATILEYEIEDSKTEDIDELNIKSHTQPNNRKLDNKTSIEHNVILAMTEARRHIGDALVSMKAITNKRQSDNEDEYDHYGHIIASKIRKIQDLDTREIVMHSV